MFLGGVAMSYLAIPTVLSRELPALAHEVAGGTRKKREAGRRRFSAGRMARQPERLDEWLEKAPASTLGAFRRFAASLRRDYAAVKAGLTVAWSTGPVEGQINRLKMLKRQTFGRAGLDLLEQRVIQAD